MPRSKKTLLLCRHAKSSWKDTQLADHDRPLNKRGKLQAPRIGEWLRKQGLQPDWIASSTARRARKTAEALAEAAGCETEPEQTEALYLAGLDAICDVVRHAPASAGIIMLVGHNPDLEELLEHLTGEAEPMRTAAVAEVTVWLSNWKDFTLSTKGDLVQVWRPPREPGE